MESDVLQEIERTPMIYLPIYIHVASTGVQNDLLSNMLQLK